MHTESVPPVADGPGQKTPAFRPYANEKVLFVIMAIISAIAWIALTISTVGLVWIAMGVLYVFGLLTFSYFISSVRGNGVHVTAEQFPDLHARFESCCAMLGMNKLPEFYLMTGNGVLNAFATRFLHRYYVILYSEIVDALDENPDALNFYIGHELGHIVQKHLVHHWWLVFARWIPLLGFAYSRAREYTCDQYGLRCTTHPDSAPFALAVLAAGVRRWKTLNTTAYIGQSQRTGGFWMSVNELTADYPWLCKRVARVQHGSEMTFPRRSVLAWILAAVVPNTGFGLIGAVILYVYLGVIFVPLGIAAYVSHAATVDAAAERLAQAPIREKLTEAYMVGMTAANLVASTYMESEELPDSLEEVGFKNANSPLISAVEFDNNNGEITLQLHAPFADNALKLSPSLDDDGSLTWDCAVTGQISHAALPDGCSNPDGEPVVEKEPAALESLINRATQLLL